jgi:hypothetical protein
MYIDTHTNIVNHGFGPRSCQTKHYNIGICYFSTKLTSLRRKSKDWWLGIEIMCPSGTTRNVVSVSIHYKYPSKHVSIMEGLTSSSSRLNTGSWKKNCWLGIKQQSLFYTNVKCILKSILMQYAHCILKLLE